MSLYVCYEVPKTDTSAWAFITVRETRLSKDAIRAVLELLAPDLSERTGEEIVPTDIHILNLIRLEE